MNEKICKIIVENREHLVPLVFTATQITLIEKWLNKVLLTATERTYLYRTISKKVAALGLFREEFYSTGEQMIPERVEEAKKILKEINKPAFISGSFLYALEHKDIDIFVIAKKRTSSEKEKKHITCILEKDLRKPLFFSALKYSVATFSHDHLQPEIKRPMFEEMLLGYELAINEVLDNDDQKEARRIVFEYYTHSKNTILNSFSLARLFSDFKKTNQHKRIELINGMVKELLLKLYSKRYLYYVLLDFIKHLKKILHTYKKHENILIYITLLEGVKDECRRAQI